MSLDNLWGVGCIGKGLVNAYSLMVRQLFSWFDFIKKKKGREVEGDFRSVIVPLLFVGCCFFYPLFKFGIKANGVCILSLFPW